MEVVKFEKESVLIKDGNIKGWVDVWIESQDVICDWNQNSFIMTDQKDVKLKQWQDNLENFEDATNMAVKTLTNARIIYQDENAKWHTNFKESNSKNI